MSTTDNGLTRRFDLPGGSEELTPRQRRFLDWLRLAPNHRAFVSNRWVDVAPALGARGLIETKPGRGGAMVSLTPAGVGYLEEVGRV